ncbi:MFS transporter [Alkalihalobacillus sp. FSL R5-0424]
MYMKKSFTKVGLATFTMIMVIGNGLFIPIMPAIQDELSLTTNQSSLLLSVFSYAGALMILLSGWLSEKFGRRIVLIASLSGLILGCVLASLAGFTTDTTQAYYLILIGRVLQGIGAGATAPMGMILASERYPKEQQAKIFSFLEIINGISKTAGPILGGVIVAYHWQAGFVWYLAIALIALAATFSLLGQEKMGLSNHTEEKLRRHMNVFLPLLSIGFFVMFFLYGLLFVISSIIEHSVWRSLFISLPLAILVLMSYLYGRSSLQSFKQTQALLKVGVLVLLIVAFFVSFFYIHVSFLVIAACVVGAVSGVMLPASTSALVFLIPEAIREKAISWLSMIRFIGVASGPIIFSAWMGNWPTYRYMFICVTLIIGLLVFNLWKEKGVMKTEMS